MGANGHNGKVNGHAHQGANGTNGAHGDPRKIRDQVVISVVAIDADAPSPIPHVPIFDPEHAYDVRKLRCRHYDQCLLRAIANKWRGFSCGACRAYAELDLEGLRSGVPPVCKPTVGSASSGSSSRWRRSWRRRWSLNAHVETSLRW